MASVYRPSGRRIYRIQFNDQHGRVRIISSGTDDKSLAESLSIKIEEDADRIRVGKEPRFPDLTGAYLGLFETDRQRRELDWEAASKAYLQEVSRLTGAGEKETRHLQLVRTTLAKLSSECGWTRIDQVHPGDLLKFLGRLAQAGRSARTQNYYLQVGRSFEKWLVDQGWQPQAHLGRIKPVEVGQAGRRYLRRAFSENELQKLCQAATPHRAMVYRVAAFSGFRRAELMRLKKEDCTPFGDRPRWHVSPVLTKNKMPARLPMSPDCAAAVCKHWAMTESGALLFPRGIDPSTKANADGVPSRKFMEIDLRKAGIERIDARGRRLDFHSLRYTFCALLSSIYPIEVVSRFMRHGSIDLTSSVYLDIGLDREGEGEWRVPPLTQTPPPHTANHTAAGA